MTKRIEIGDVQATVVWFASKCAPQHLYGVFAERPDYIAFINKYDSSTHMQATGVNLEGCDERFFAVWVDDCFDPPIAIVRADNESEAEEWFADELNWAHITEPDLADYDPETLHYNSDGKPYETESIGIREVWMVRVECDNPI